MTTPTRRRTRDAITGLLVIFVAVGLVQLRLEQRHVGAVQARLAFVQHHQNDALRSIMCRAEALVRKTPASQRFTAKQKRQAIRFYSSAIADAHLAPCNNQEGR